MSAPTFEAVRYTPVDAIALASFDTASLQDSIATIGEASPGLLLSGAAGSRVHDAIWNLGYEKVLSYPFGQTAQESPPLIEVGQPLRTFEEWQRAGITPLHSDAEAGRRVLSVAVSYVGELSLELFDWGTEGILEGANQAEVCARETARIICDKEVDIRYFSAHATSFRVSPGQCLVFDNSRPHMARSVVLPRHSISTFFRKDVEAAPY